ncbi:MAG: HlyD family secretion protein [Candidatus Azotimanducaceae bacterium]|jgi:HlyD family secretion protein
MLLSTQIVTWLTLITLFNLVTQPARADVSALGRLEPLNGVMKITAPVIPEAGNGVVLGSLNVKSGDRVKAGDLLGIAESSKILDALKDQAAVALKLAEENGRASAAQADAACVRATVSRREADRRRSLFEQNLSSLEESERASADAEFQEATCHASRISSQASLSEIDLAKSYLVVRHASLARAYIYAPVSGRILHITAWPGESVGPEGVLELGQTETMYAIAEVYETDIHKVAVNQTATISSPALPTQLTGVVEHIRPLIRKQDVTDTDPAARKDARVVEVEIRIDEPGLVESLTNLQVEIIIEN